MLLRSAIIIGLVGIFASSGCGKKGLAIYPVQGEVRVDGRPTPGVMVIFCPVNGSEVVKRMRPTAFSGSDGKFQLTAFEKGDGAPAGQYNVLMQWVSDSPPSPAGEVNMGPDRLQSRYMNLDQSQFTVDVKEEANELPPFELKSK